MKLIDKDALVADIEKIIADETESIKSFEHHKNISEVQRSNARIGMLMYIRSLLDTLEVKEVDLDKMSEDYIKEKFGESIEGFMIKPIGFYDLMLFAEHFFELGMAVSNKSTEGEKV